MIVLISYFAAMLVLFASATAYNYKVKWLTKGDFEYFTGIDWILFFAAILFYPITLVIIVLFMVAKAFHDFLIPD